jgi:transcriptional regulator with XRE-family HTH domain
MSQKANPADLQILVRLLLAWQDLTREGLAERAGLSRNTMTNYLEGKTTPSRAMVERLAEAAEVPLHIVDVFLLPAIAEDRRRRTAAGESQAPALLGRLADQLRALPSLLAASPIRLGRSGEEARESWEPAGTVRQEALDLWQRLEDLEDEDRWYLVERWEEFRHPGLAELLCHKSADAASDRADRALELARLGHRVAVLAPGEEARKRRLEGYALVFLANAMRVSGDLPAARRTFGEGLASWKAAEGCSTFLAEWRVLDVEASLLRDERQFASALDRLAEALNLASVEHTGRILLNKSAVLEQMGEGEQAVKELRKAERYIHCESEPRQFLILRFNLAANLCLLDRFQEAEDLLPEIGSLVSALQRELDGVRLKWLQGRVGAGRGRLDEAEVLLEEVRQEFTTRRSAWDCSLVTLELAVVRLRQGRAAEVRSLAAELVWIFEAQGIHQGALAALTLFREAAERDQATVDLADRLVRYLRKAQGDPEMRFVGS